MAKEKKKKILYFITQSEFGGAQRYCLDLATNPQINHEIAVALGEVKNNSRFIKILQGHNIQTFILPRLKRNISPINDLLAFFEIIKLIKAYQPDIIHLNSSKISILGSFAVLFSKSKIQNLKSKIIYTAHGWVFNEPLPWLLKKFYLYAEKFTARFKDKIICVSEYDRQIALKRKIAPADKLITIHNGIAPVKFYAREEARERISRVAGYELRVTRLIGSIGHLYKTKGYEYLIQAANILINRRHLPLTFIIIGEGKERKNLENLIKKNRPAYRSGRLENNFILTGSIDDAAKLLTAFDLYVCSSVKEGWPYSILEAMQAGLPIISTDVGGLPEMIENKKTGLLVKPADPDDLAEKITLLLNNTPLALELGRCAKAKASADFTLEKMTKETKNIYNQ